MSFSVYWRKLQRGADKSLKLPAFFVIGFYRLVIRGLLGGGGGCRFYPSCGDYALQVYGRYSFFEATKRLFRRLLNCHPFGPVGFLPELPEKEEKAPLMSGKALK